MNHQETLLFSHLHFSIYPVAGVSLDLSWEGENLLLDSEYKIDPDSQKSGFLNSLLTTWSFMDHDDSKNSSLKNGGYMDEGGFGSGGVWNIFPEFPLDTFVSFSLFLGLSSSGNIFCGGLFLSGVYLSLDQINYLWVASIPSKVVL